MRNLAAILLVGILLFNWLGYRVLDNIAENDATHHLEARLDRQQYDDQQLISRLQTLSEDFETEVEGWQIDRVRSELKTDRYFHGVYYPKSFQIDGRKYVHGLAALARRGAPAFASWR